MQTFDSTLAAQAWTALIPAADLPAQHTSNPSSPAPRCCYEHVMQNRTEEPVGMSRQGVAPHLMTAQRREACTQSKRAAMFWQVVTPHLVQALHKEGVAPCKARNRKDPHCEGAPMPLPQPRLAASTSLLPAIYG